MVFTPRFFSRLMRVVIEQFPLLFHKTSTGAIQEWQIEVHEKNHVATVVVVYGQRDGEKQTVERQVTEGKNLGKKNETSPLRQAVLESKSLWQKKKDKGYVESLAEVDFSPKLPMLAHPYGDRKHKIKFPAFAQPKLDGVRCLATKLSETEMLFTSRNAKVFRSLSHLARHYLSILNIGETVDGEVYNPKITFQELVSAVKDPEKQVPLYHFVYDFPTVEGGFLKRFEELEKRLALLDRDSPILLVPTKQVDTHEEFLKIHETLTKKGYEGSILRNAEGEYKYDYRSTDLLKHKDFVDAEYEIVDVAVGRLGNKGEVGVPVCKCPRTGLEFSVMVEGPFEAKQDILLHPENYKGKLLTVRYQKLSDDGIPIFPVGVGVRGYE